MLFGANLDLKCTLDISFGRESSGATSEQARQQANQAYQRSMNEIIVLRLVHILGGVFWVGGGFSQVSS